MLFSVFGISLRQQHSGLALNFADSPSSSTIAHSESTGCGGNREAFAHTPLGLRSAHSMRGLVPRLVNRISRTFTTPPVLRWLEWGPQSTRWRDAERHAQCGCALALIDFSPGRLVMLLSQDSAENSGLRLVATPTKINARRYLLVTSHPNHRIANVRRKR
jgi:hypothetical protein